MSVFRNFGGISGRGPTITNEATLLTDTLTKVTFDYSNVDIGAATASRMVVVLCTGSSGTPRELTSLTVGGIAASLYKPAGDNKVSACIAVVSVPTGDSVSVIATYSGPVEQNACKVMSVFGANGAYSSGTDTGYSYQLETSLVMQDNAIMFSSGVSEYGTVPLALSGIGEDFNIALEADSTHIGGYNSTADDTITLASDDLGYLSLTSLIIT